MARSHLFVDSETEAIKTIWRVIGLCGLVPTQRRSFVPARDDDRCGPERGPMNVPGLAQKTAKGTSTVKAPSSGICCQMVGHPHQIRPYA